MTSAFVTTRFNIGPTREWDTSLDIILDKDAVVCLATIFAGEETLSVTASAKKETGDKFNPNIGTKLAAGRALEKLGLKLQKQANGLVTQEENLRKNKLIKKEPVKRLRKKK
jgi:hypothetical protein